MNGWHCINGDIFSGSPCIKMIWIMMNIVSRKYWHCLKEDAEPVHLTCDTDEQGEFMMWDLMFDGCNFGAQTDCGERQVCDDCNEECWPHGGGGDDSLDCDHDMGQ